MKKIYLLFIMTIMLGSCEKEELEKNIKHPSQQDLELIDYNDLPSPLLFNLQNFNYGLESKGARPFGEIDENIKIKRIVDKNGIPSYTFSLKKIDNKTSVQNSPGYYFDNLVVQAGKEYKTIILRYQPTLAWQTGNRDLRNFSGNILFLSVEGEKRNTLILENGVPIDSPPNNEKLVCHYTFSHAVIITSGDGSSSSSYTVYYYTERCSASEIHEPGGGGGCKSQNCGPTEPESIPTIPTEGDPDWDFGAGGGGSSQTAEVVVKIDIDSDLKQDYPCIAEVITIAYQLCSELNIDFLEYFESSNDFHVIYSSQPMDGLESAKAVNALGCSLPCTTNIVFNENYFGTMSNLSIAANTIHENTHAMLFYLWKSGEMGYSLLNPTYQELAEAYSNVLASGDSRNDGTGQTLMDLQHEYMVKFTDRLASTLLNYANSQNINIDMDYSRKMIWGGTFTTLASYVEKFTLNERYEINAIVNSELNNQSYTYNLSNGSQQTTSPKGEVVTNDSCD